MPETTITPQELNNRIQAVFQELNQRNPEVGKIVYLMKEYGLRISEASRLGVITTKIQQNEYLVQIEKTNSLRKINTTAQDGKMIDELIRAGKNGIIYTKGQIRRMIATSRQLVNIHIKNKPSVTHLFRHNKIKQMYGEGSTVTEIAQYMGISKNIAREYINSAVKIII